MRRVLLLLPIVGLAVAGLAIYLLDGSDDVVLLDPDCPPRARFPIVVTHPTRGGGISGDDDLAAIAQSGAVRRLTKDNASFDPSFSPDGTEVAFTRGDGHYSDTLGWESQGISVMDLDGGNRRVLTKGHFDSNPAWSPDGDSIVFARSQAGLMLVPATGGKSRTLVSEEETALEAADESHSEWSPDGDRIAFISVPEAIYVINEDGSGLRRIASHLGSIRELAWSPDGETFAFGDGNSIYTLSMEEPNPRLFVRRASSPEFSPNGEHLLYFEEPKFSDAVARLVTRPLEEGEAEPVGENRTVGGLRQELDWLNCR